VFAVPGLLLAGFGIAHPAVLDAATASWWTTLHVVLLPVFPLLAVAQWQMLSSAPSWLRIPGRLAAYGFATFYGGLDAVAGIAAGAVADAQHAVTPVIGAVFAIGDLLGHVGAACFLAANVVIVIAATLRSKWRSVPGGLLLLIAGLSFIDSHIFWPRGVFTMLAVAIGMAQLSYVYVIPSRSTEPAGN